MTARHDSVRGIEKAFGRNFLLKRQRQFCANPSLILRQAQDDRIAFAAVLLPFPRSQVALGNALAGILFAILLCLAPIAHADVTGTVTIKGHPNSKDESFYARANGCGESPIRHTENWKIGPKGELGDVVVWIVNPKLSGVGDQKARVIEIKQIGCRYDPHVIAVKAGVPFSIINGDPTLHNIRAKVYNGPGQPPGDDVFNFGQSYQGQTDERQFDTPGTYTLQCDVHSWMQAWVMALDSYCFAVTGAAGTFKILMSDQLADGDYKIDVWHPRFAQTLEQTVHVKGGVGIVNFQFDGTKSF